MVCVAARVGDRAAARVVDRAAACVNARAAVCSTWAKLAVTVVHDTHTCPEHTIHTLARTLRTLTNP